jgi:hypothetical protein
MVIQSKAANCRPVEITGTVKGIQKIKKKIRITNEMTVGIRLRTAYEKSVIPSFRRGVVQAIPLLDFTCRRLASA